MFDLLTDDLVARLSEMDEDGRGAYVFVEKHAAIPRHFVAHSFSPGDFQQVYGDIVGRRRIVTPFNFPALFERARERGHKVVWIDDPTEVFEWFETLNEDPDVEIESKMPGTRKGFLAFQLQGYNFAKDLTGAVLQWSTGTGKTVGAAALTRHHLDHTDICLWVVKKHNKINTQRALSALVGVDSLIVDGTRDARDETYGLAEMLLSEGETVTLVLNYEKFRDDEDAVSALLDGRRVLIVWDEMPTKLKNRKTKLYKSVARCLYGSEKSIRTGRERPSTLRQIALTATPIENSPEDFFNCVRLLDPSVFGTIAEFHNQYVATYSPFGYKVPERWKNLDLMGAVASKITHQVDKADPDIAAMFPQVMEVPVLVDLDELHQSLYDHLMEMYVDGKTNSEFDEVGILAKIGVAQMILDDPGMVVRSAQNREESLREIDDDPDAALRGSRIAQMLVDRLGEAAFADVPNAKMEALRDALDTLGEGEKGIVFTTFNKALIPALMERIAEWGYPNVCYTGTMSVAERQRAQDRFATDPECRVFISSDAGSDSINLEIANLVVHYDLPWKWSTLIQRQNRAHRITSKFSRVRFVVIMAANSVEDRKQEILLKKEWYHTAVLKGSVAEVSGSARISRKEMSYILEGGKL